jgi:hypothetical protein
MMPVEKALGESNALDMPDAVRDDWCCQNALAYLGM